VAYISTWPGCGYGNRALLINCFLDRTQGQRRNPADVEIEIEGGKFEYLFAVEKENYAT